MVIVYDLLKLCYLITDEFKKKSDLGNFKQSIANIENALDNIKKSDENQKGSIKSMLEDFKNKRRLIITSIDEKENFL